MSAYNKIAEEAEELRFKVLKKMGVQPPEEVAFLFNEYSHYFEEIIFEKWREEKRFDELIDYVLYQYDHAGGEAVWSQVLFDLKLNNEEVRALKFLQSLIAGRSVLFWDSVNKRKNGEKNNIYTEIAIANNKGELTKVLFEYLYILENQKKDLQNKNIIQKLHNQIFEIINEEKKPLPKALDTVVNERQFWLLIQKSTKKAKTEADFLNSLEKDLELLKSREIQKFSKLLIEKLNKLNNSDLWGIAYIILDGCSDDMFEYYKMWIISQGEELYLAALNGTESFSKLIEPKWGLQCEGLLLAIENAYLSRTGKILSQNGLNYLENDLSWDEVNIKKRFNAEIMILKGRKII